MSYLTRLHVALLLITTGASCQAADLWLNAGSTLIHGATETVGLRVVFQNTVSDNRADIEIGFQLLGPSDYEGEQPKQAVIITQIVSNISRVDFGLGLAFLQNSDIYNSGRFNFSLLARYDFSKHLSAEWTHISNGGTHSPNMGRNMVTASYKF